MVQERKERGREGERERWREGERHVLFAEPKPQMITTYHSKLEKVSDTSDSIQAPWITKNTVPLHRSYILMIPH